MKAHYSYIWVEGYINSGHMYATEEEVIAKLRGDAWNYFRDNSECTELEVLIGSTSLNYASTIIFDRKR